MKTKSQFRFSQNFTEIMAVTVLGAFLVFYLIVLIWPQGNPYDSVKVTIAKGASLKEVSLTLKNQNVIRNDNPNTLIASIFFSFASVKAKSKASNTLSPDSFEGSANLYL